MSSKTAHILIIDDEPPLLRMMSLYLQRQGYQVTVAANAMKARAELAAGQGSYTVVVVDASLPGATLEELGEEILRGNPGARLLASSGYPVNMSRLEALAPGRVAFLLKPFSPDMLAESVRRLIGGEKKEGV
jgi:DNA-binding NtrC family response regulator